MYIFKKRLQKYKTGNALEKEFKIKPLTKQQIIISLDRLTRFKYTEDKYLRVFKDIVSSNLINPKYKKKELDLMDYDELTDLAQNILNVSLNTLKQPLLGDFSINKKLLKYEKSIFKFNKNVEKLLKNKIDYGSATTLMKDELNLAPNLRWLISLAEDENQFDNREKSALKFPLEKIVIAEGITEEILLPEFAKLCGYDFDEKGVHLISAGGKNQVVRVFYQLVDTLKLPIFVLLDKDADENYEEIKPKLRKNDKVCVLEIGEFEDILPLNLIKRTLNRHFETYFSVKLYDLRKDMPMTQILTEIFKERGQEFKKAEFATLVCENLSDFNDVSNEIKKIISTLNTNCK